MLENEIRVNRYIYSIPEFDAKRIISPEGSTEEELRKFRRCETTLADTLISVLSKCAPHVAMIYVSPGNFLLPTSYAPKTRGLKDYTHDELNSEFKSRLSDRLRRPNPTYPSLT